MTFTRNFVANVPHGNNGPKEYLGHYRYDTKITTRDCVLALSDYPDNRYYLPTDKLIKDNFDRIVDVTGIEPLRVFNNEEDDERLTYEIVSNILLLTQDRQICYDTVGRFWSQFSVIWRMYSELTRQHLVQIYKGIYRDSDSTSDSVGNSNNSSDSTSLSKSKTTNTNDSRNQSGSVGASVSESNSDSDARNSNSTLPQDQVVSGMKPKSDVLGYADNVSINKSEQDSHQESLNTSDAEGHNWGWSLTNSESSSENHSIGRSDNTSSSHSVGISRGIFSIYDEWVRSYRDMTGGMYYQMQRAGLWSIFI